MQVRAERAAVTVTHRSDRLLLAALVDDVELQRERHERAGRPRAVDAAVEAFAMLGRDDALPVDPDAVAQPLAVEVPFETRFVRPLERQRLALERRQQAVRPGAIGPERRT